MAKFWNYLVVSLQYLDIKLFKDPVQDYVIVNILTTRGWLAIFEMLETT